MQPVGLRPAATRKHNLEATRRDRKNRLIAEAKDTLKMACVALKLGDTVEACKLRLESKRIREMATEKLMLPPPGRQLSSDMYCCTETIVDGIDAPHFDIVGLSEEEQEQVKRDLAGSLVEGIVGSFRRAAVRDQVSTWGNLLWHTAERFRRGGHSYEQAETMARAQLQSYAEPLVERAVQEYALCKAPLDALATAERLMVARGYSR